MSASLTALGVFSCAAVHVESTWIHFLHPTQTWSCRSAGEQRSPQLNICTPLSGPSEARLLSDSLSHCFVAQAACFPSAGHSACLGVVYLKSNIRFAIFFLLCYFYPAFFSPALNHLLSRTVVRCPVFERYFLILLFYNIFWRDWISSVHFSMFYLDRRRLTGSKTDSDAQTVNSDWIWASLKTKFWL